MENMSGTELVVMLGVLWGIGLLSLYAVVRAAVRGGIADAWERRADRERSSQP